MPDSFWIALGVYALVIVSPGPAFVLMTKVGLQEQRAVAFCSMLGYVCGATTNATLAMFAVGTLAERHAGVGLFVSVFGGGFLLLLAAGSFRKAWEGRRAEDRANGQRAFARERSVYAGFRNGLLVSLSNPKALAFFVAVFAPLVSGLSFESKGVLVLFGFVMKFLWYGLVVVMFRRKRIQRLYWRNVVACDGILGALFVGMGGGVLWEARHYGTLLGTLLF